MLVSALLAAPLADAAGPTATTAAPTVQTSPQTPPGSAFSPLSPQVDTGPQTQSTITATKRAGDTGTGRGTLLFLSLVALAMIAGVGWFIWYEGRKRGSAAKSRRQRHRMRSGRTPQPAAATGARRGPPPPPRKRRAQAAKRKKR